LSCCGPGIAGSDETFVLCMAQQMHGGVLTLQQAHRIVSGSVIDYDGFERRVALSSQRVQTDRQQMLAIEVGDDDAT